MTDGNSTPYGLIYCVKHIETGRVYIGQTTQSLEKRWSSHRRDPVCVRLSRAIKKYGDSAFSIKEICVAYTKSELDEKEIEFISLFESTDRKKGFNLMTGGSFGKHSQESKEKMSKAVLKAYENPEFKKKLSAARLGFKQTKEQRDAASKRMMGFVPTEKAREKSSRHMKALWETDDYREKVSHGQAESRACIDYIRVVSENTKAQWQDPEKRSKLTASLSIGKLAMWADPVRKAAFIAKRNATNAAKKAAAN